MAQSPHLSPRAPTWRIPKYRSSRKACTLGNKLNKYHRVRNEGENRSEIGNIAGQEKAGSIATADLTIRRQRMVGGAVFSARGGASTVQFIDLVG
jgi:hypothetical protein